MGKTRVHELAAEFGISAEQLMGLLKEAAPEMATGLQIQGLKKATPKPEPTVN